MTTDPLAAQGSRLLQSNPSLLQLIQFTRDRDPTNEFLAEWGQTFEARRDDLLSKARDALRARERFPGSNREVLLCMAFCVATAPYLGTPEDQVRNDLKALLAELV